jgi:AraC family transcriptional regulator of adaptative response/methylated-DNA-[protein]-cysteine methyltransferase
MKSLFNIPARKSVDGTEGALLFAAMGQLDYQGMVTAMNHNDTAYDGRFYVGVMSTGIFCLPSCRARLPRLKNVRFFATREEAIAAGLRGCKRCRAALYPDVLPEWLPLVLAHMRAHRDQRLDEDRLMNLTAVHISTVRRYFKTHLQTTPLAFHRRLRLTFARELIESGTDYLNAAYASGYESPSGFRDAFMRQFGQPPGRFYARTNDRRS